MTATLPHFVFYLSADWETYHRPDMIRAFARAVAPSGARVLLVDRLLCPLTTPLRGIRSRRGGPSRGPAKWARWGARTLAARPCLQRLDDNLFIGRAFVACDDRFLQSSPGLRNLNRALLARRLHGWLGRLGMLDRPHVGWFQHPFWEHYAGMPGQFLAVYECFDCYAADPGAGGRRIAAIESAERRLLARVDLVITTSNALLAEKRLLHPRVRCVHNGADLAFYSRALDPAILPVPILDSLAPPVVGYLGTLNEHTDFRLIASCAALRPRWTFVLAGKPDHKAILADPAYHALERLPNVRCLGWVDRDRLLPILKSFTVCIIPYRRDSDFNRYVNPNKLHEYTALGKPIVSTSAVEIDTHRDLVEVADDPESFVAAIERAWRADSPALIKVRLDRAASASWDSRVAEMLGHLAPLLPRNSSAVQSCEPIQDLANSALR